MRILLESLLAVQIAAWDYTYPAPEALLVYWTETPKAGVEPQPYPQVVDFTCKAGEASYLELAPWWWVGFEQGDPDTPWEKGPFVNDGEVYVCSPHCNPDTNGDGWVGIGDWSVDLDCDGDNISGGLPDFQVWATTFGGYVE